MPGSRPEEAHRALAAILDAVRAREPTLRASIEIALARPGTEVATDSPLVARLLDAARTHGLSATMRGMTAWVDAAFLNEAGIPAVCFGPGSMAHAHTADEWIDVAQIRTCADVLETFARGLSG